MILPKSESGMDNPLEEDIYYCPDEEIRDPEPRKPLKVITKLEFVIIAL